MSDLPLWLSSLLKNEDFINLVYGLLLYLVFITLKDLYLLHKVFQLNKSLGCCSMSYTYS